MNRPPIIVSILIGLNLLVIFFLLSQRSTSSVTVLAGHTLPTSGWKCGRDIDGIDDHCYARREEAHTDAVIRAVTGIFPGNIDPCVPSYIKVGGTPTPTLTPGPTATPGPSPTPPSGPHFSVLAVWIAGERAVNYTPWIEIGVIKHDNGSNSFDPEIYSYCGDCGLSEEDAWGNHGPVGSGVNYFTLRYDDASHCWLVKVNGTMARDPLCNIPYMGLGTRTRVGGETTHYSIDMGLGVYQGLQVYKNSAWSPYNDQSGVGTAFHYASGRYRSKFRYTSAYPPGSSMKVWSDHHDTHDPDACGNIP